METVCSHCQEGVPLHIQHTHPGHDYYGKPRCRWEDKEHFSRPTEPRRSRQERAL